METKIIKKHFELADFLEAQDFFTNQHKDGWKLKSHTKNEIVFEKCEPENYVYRIKLNDNKKDEAEYLQMFSDCGWEYIQKSDKWYYFRKPKSENEADNKIFSDNASKAEMCKKMLQKQNNSFIPLYIIVLAWNYIVYFTEIFKINSVIYTIALGLGSLSLLAIVYQFGVGIYNINKISKMIRSLTPAK
jgi:hypothetical protein